LSIVRRSAFALLVALALTGCASVSTAPAPWGLHRADEADDYLLSGPADSQLIIEAVGGVEHEGCRARIEVIRPKEVPTTTPTLIFAHGLFRDIAQHRDFARHLAGWGIPVALTGLCSGGWGRGSTQLYAQLLQSAATRIGAGRVVYGGFSAGGAAAALAANQDPRAGAFIGLDPVSRNLADGPLRVPALGLFAPAAACNAYHAGRALFAARNDHVTLEVSGATHCHFESPSNWLCRLACGEPHDARGSTALRARITAAATAFARAHAGLDSPPRTSWWAPSAGVFEPLATKP
jgi:dienelactone hydrolase